MFFLSEVDKCATFLTKALLFLMSTLQILSWEDKCWVLYDGYGGQQGPHSLTELYGWYQYGYLQSSVMVSSYFSYIICLYAITYF